MTTLNGKIAFIAGGAGNVGEGIVRSFLKAGATVITTSRKQEKLEELRGYLGDLANDNFVPIVGDLGDLESAEKLRNQILEKFNRLDTVVASIGGTWSGVSHDSSLNGRLAEVYFHKLNYSLRLRSYFSTRAD